MTQESKWSNGGYTSMKGFPEILTPLGHPGFYERWYQGRNEIIVRFDELTEELQALIRPQKEV